jgi:hypothetical protein
MASRERAEVRGSGSAESGGDRRSNGKRSTLTPHRSSALQGDLGTFRRSQSHIREASQGSGTLEALQARHSAPTTCRIQSPTLNLPSYTGDADSCPPGLAHLAGCGAVLSSRYRWKCCEVGLAVPAGVHPVLRARSWKHGGDNVITCERDTLGGGTVRPTSTWSRHP